MTKYGILLLFPALLCMRPCTSQTGKSKTAFQVAEAWDPRYDVRSDIAIVYGVNDAGGNLPGRIKSWKDKGYEVHFMTGIAWGQYQDYFLGKFDGRQHFEEGQRKRNGDTIWHGHHVPYIVPSESFINYLKTHVKAAIDAGARAIHLEEPEFWTEAGYSEAFKKEWQAYYHTAWRPQHESPDATYLSSKLKYHLYYRALDEMFRYVKEYARQTNKDVKCYVPTHSLLNYAAWGIVSPEASLASLTDMDGYIAQVWTGTSREPVYFNGQQKERVFENAFLEYGAMVSMTAPTKRKMFFLTDPIEDRPQTWDDYKTNYQATFTAKLLYPSVSNYEVMPWPNRIYLGRFKTENSTVEQSISPAYATQMQVMVNALNEMPASPVPASGSRGIGILVSNSMMFQRFPTHEGYQDPQLSNFYGMALPLIKRGVPAETVHMENLLHPEALKNTQVLVMSYSNYKPMDSAYHYKLRDWVQQGGVLLYYGNDADAFQQITEWWNSGNNHYPTASAHLFTLLGVDAKKTGAFLPVGRGRVCITRTDPKNFVLVNGGDSSFMRQVAEAYERYAKKGSLVYKNYFDARRGPYRIVAVMSETVPKDPYVVAGPAIDLFDPALPVVYNKAISPGSQGFFYELGKSGKNKAAVLAAAGRISRLTVSQKAMCFRIQSPSGTKNSMRIQLPRKPSAVSATCQNKPVMLEKNEWDTASHTLLLSFDNDSEGIEVVLTLK